jgi:hypothetical protein
MSWFIAALGAVGQAARSESAHADSDLTFDAPSLSLISLSL